MIAHHSEINYVMRIEKLKFESTVEKKKETAYDESNKNHLLIEFFKNASQPAFVGYISLQNKLNKMSGPVSMYLNFKHFTSEKNTDNYAKFVDKIKYVIEKLTKNSNVKKIKVIIVAMNYDAAYSQIYGICCSEAVLYNSRNVDRFILTSLIRKIIGPGHARRIYSIKSFICRH